MNIKNEMKEEKQFLAITQLKHMRVTNNVRLKTIKKFQMENKPNRYGNKTKLQS